MPPLRPENRVRARSEWRASNRSTPLAFAATLIPQQAQSLATAQGLRPHTTLRDYAPDFFHRGA